MSDDLTRPSGQIVAVTKSDSVSLVLADGRAPRALLCGTAGTANLRDQQGNILANVPLQQGYNPISVTQVRTSGTADDIWALY